MTTTKDINLGTLLPLIIFLSVQTGGAIWWASNISTNQDNLSKQIAVLDARLEEAVADSDAEQLRQWSRINSNEDNLTRAIARDESFIAQIETLRGTIADMRSDLRANNDLLREVLVRLGPEN